MFRIQKLLLNEYTDFEETVLVESPFAQVTEFGIGIKQVQIALTASKLIIANDTFNKYKTLTLKNILYDRQDPEIETMELSTMLPLEFLYIKVFRKGTRQLMKVSVGAIKVLWFEFGGHVLKNTYWNIWRERISSLRANQTYVPRYEPQYPVAFDSAHDDITTPTTTDQSIPEPQEVIVDVHQLDDSELDQSMPVKKFKNLMGSFKLFPKTNKTNQIHSVHSRRSSSSPTELPKCDQEMLIREVADYFLDTQSDIVVGQHIYGYESCNGSCRNFLHRSASVTNLVNDWNTSCNGY